jgi:hypothetical protein
MKKISSEEFDRRFDAGEDICSFVDWASARPFFPLTPATGPIKVARKPARTMARAKRFPAR